MYVVFWSTCPDNLDRDQFQRDHYRVAETEAEARDRYLDLIINEKHLQHAAWTPITGGALDDWLQS